MHPHVPDLTHHHRTFAAAVAAFALAVLAVAVPARLADRTLTFSGASSAAPAAPAAPAATAPAVRPAWIDRPLASPLGSLVSAGSRPAPSSG